MVHIGRRLIRDLPRHWRPVAMAAALTATAMAIVACGEQKTVQPSGGILTLVRVEEMKADGSWAPVVNARVHYEIYGTKDIAANIARYQVYDDVTDQDGYSAVLRSPEGKTDSEIGLIFVDVEHPDGRTAFKKPRSSTHFDLVAWFEEFLPAPVDREAAMRAICATASDFPDCEQSLKAADLKTWGAAVLIRFQ